MDPDTESTPVERDSTRRRKSTVTHLSVRQKVELLLNEGQQFTLGEMTNRIGFGWYQVHVFVASFGALMVEASTIAMVTGLVTPISEEFHVEGNVARAGFAGCLYFGVQMGTVVTAGLADIMGRRRPMIAGYAGMVIFGVATAFAPNAGAVYAFLFFVGLFGGLCVPCAIISLAEVLPTGLRGACSAALGVSFRCGWLWSAFGLRLFVPMLDTGPWRWLMVWSVAPAPLFLLWTLASPAARQDTPYFLAISGQSRAMVSSINLMADMNHHPECRLILPEAVRAEQTASSVTLREVATMMSTFPLWLHCIVMILLFFSKEFVAGGSTAYWPITFAELHQGSHELGFRDSALTQLSVGVGRMTPATEMVVTTLVSFPGIAASMAIMHWLPRRPALALGAGLTSVGALLLLGLHGQNMIVGLLGVLLIQLLFPLWQMCTMILGSEVFPTQVRGMAYSSSYFLGRFGSELAQLCVHSGKFAFPLATAALGLATLFLVQCLPETKGTELANFCLEPQADGRKRATPSYGAVEQGEGAGSKANAAA